MNKKSIIALIATIPLAFSLTACSSNESQVVETPDETATEAEAAPEAEETPDDENKRPAFGETVEYKDGVKLTVSEPEEFEPGEWAIGADGEGTSLKFTVTLENGSDKNLEPGLINFTASSGGAEAEQIFDSEAGVEGGPSTSLLPGKSVSWTIGFQVADPDDIVMDVNLFDDFSRGKTTYVK